MSHSPPAQVWISWCDGCGRADYAYNSKPDEAGAGCPRCETGHEDQSLAGPYVRNRGKARPDLLAQLASARETLAELLALVETLPAPDPQPQDKGGDAIDPVAVAGRPGGEVAAGAGAEVKAPVPAQDEEPTNAG